ncbi:hypothetical protein HGRIS_003781 [Hohenbuehelia grisea]|uniref:NAD-dependent epimerase/dehydratase domain-containing protein n=1 Tax=Hohenbuehelia grisea TaxID=104357 RepID=A0ABR3JGN2_9AGAR
MKIAITGCNGSVGQRVVVLALKLGHTVLGIDLTEQGNEPEEIGPYAEQFAFVQTDLSDYSCVLELLRGHEAVIHLAAIRYPADYVVKAHNTNVVLSWNILRASAELGITRIAQASSVNVITMVYSQQARFEYFPIDESHPCLPDEPYGLSKVICELQADTIVRRYPSMRIASLRLHWSVPNRAYARQGITDPERKSKDLWGYVQEDSGAEAFMLAITKDDLPWTGHQQFFIVAPEIAYEGDSGELKEKFWPKVPVREGKEIAGKVGFFDCSKAQRLLGWVHRD